MAGAWEFVALLVVAGTMTTMWWLYCRPLFLTKKTQPEPFRQPSHVRIIRREDQR
jgi:hypothetical protein